MAYLAALTLDRGRRAGLLATAGVAAGLSVHAIVAALGLGVVISKAPIIYDLLRWVGVAYILFLAWEAWQSDKGRSDLTGSASSPLFWRGFLSNVFNPKSIIFFVSVIPGFVRYDSGGAGLLLQIARLGAIYVAIATVIHAGIVLLAGQLRPFLVSEGRRHRLVRRMLALALVLVAAWLAWTTRRS
jgi:threonine/homoserine/homoserine lactone efflux protein